MKAKPTVLECEHEVWFTLLPSPGDSVYCERCGDYSKVPAHDERGSYYPVGEWKAFPTGARRVRGVCFRQQPDGEYGCGFERTGEFARVRDKLEKHHRLGCQEPQLDFTYVALPKNSPAPF